MGLLIYIFDEHIGHKRELETKIEKHFVEHEYTKEDTKTTWLVIPDYEQSVPRLVCVVEHWYEEDE